MKKRTLTITDGLRRYTRTLTPTDKVLVTQKPKQQHIERAYFFRWVEACKKVPPDQWQTAAKSRRDKQGRFTPKPKPMLISDMNTMQLVNTIKWCVKLATQALSTGLFAQFSVSKAQLLAPVPQWRALLDEAEKRQLHIVGIAPYLNDWFQEAKIAIVYLELDK